MAQANPQQAALRAAERERKAHARLLAQELKVLKQRLLEARMAEVETLNSELTATNATLEGLLAATLDRDDHLEFDALKSRPAIPPFRPGALATPEIAPDIALKMPHAPSRIAKLVPGAQARHTRAVESAREQHALETAAYEKRERKRKRALTEARAAYNAETQAINSRAATRNSEIDELQTRFEANDAAAIVEYFSLVLDHSMYPEGFSKTHRMAFVPESRQLVIELELPQLSVVPTTKQYRYVRARDAIENTPRPMTQVKALYASVVAQTAIRTLHELFEGDRDGRLETIVFNGYVETIDPATGKAISPHLVTVRTSHESFERLDLRNVEPLACLRGLNASVSKSPSELTPVRPILEFNMVDSRFVQESDVLGTLDERPNLMDLTPGEFEGLITNLFEKMGLETRQTQASRDGGVDCVAYDPRPIFGGKVVIQAKRYKHTVGVSAVRDLFGTLQNEGASKGILVTTSGYGRSSFDFAEGKPLELLSGTHLLYLLAEHAGIEARIEPPDDWIDPATDVISDEAQIARPQPGAEIPREP